jgi:hypothetical protein
MNIIRRLSRRYEIPVLEFRTQYDITEFIESIRWDSAANMIIVETISEDDREARKV